MGLVGGVLRLALRGALVLGAFAAVLLLVPGLPPYCSFTAIQLTPPLPREGVLAPNNALDNAKREYLDKLHGPEAFQVHNDALYTTLSTGEVVKLSAGGHITFVTKIGLPCEGLWQEHKCGRPLGFRIDDAGKYLYVVDAYYGIWKVDLKTDQKQLLVSPRADIEGRAPRLFNSVALAKNGDLYWTDSSADFQLRDGAYTSLVDPSGRLFHYNAARNQSRVLINGLWFANGVAVSPNEEFVITNECLTSRIHRIYVNGPKKGQKDIFLDGIPGIPDNIQPLADGTGVLIGLYKVFDEQHPMISRSVSQFPLLRKFVARLTRLIEIPFEYLNDQFPHPILEKIVYSIGHFNSMAPLTPRSSGIIQVDWSGKIVGAWFNQDGTTDSISDAIVFRDTLYMGSPHTNFLASVPAPQQLKLAFASQKASPPPKVPEPLKLKEQPKKEKPIERTKPTEAPPVKKTSAEPAKATKLPSEEKKTEPKQQTKPVTEKPTQQTTPPPKPAVQQPKVPADTPKTTTPKPTPKSEPPKKVETLKKPDTTEPPKKGETPNKAPKQRKQEEKKPEQIPIVEDIKVDTARPVKEPLKVIKREGPAEIPHPEL